MKRDKGEYLKSRLIKQS